MAFSGGEYLVTGTATSIASALGITDIGKLHYAEIVLFAEGADAFFGPSTVTTTTNRAGVLRSTATVPVTLTSAGMGRLLNIKDIYLVGTAGAGNIVHIALVE